jgi:hypothetical protein
MEYPQVRIENAAEAGEGDPNIEPSLASLRRRPVHKKPKKGYKPKPAAFALNRFHLTSARA